MLFVSHDRYFIDGLATRVFEVEDHRVHIYPGNYEDYLWRKSAARRKSQSRSQILLKPIPAAIEPATQPGAPHLILRCGIASHDAPNTKPAAKRLNPIKLKQIEDRLTAIEQELVAIDSRIEATEQSLGHYISAEESQRTAATLDELREQRTALLAEWDSLASTLEEQSSASTA